MFLNAPAKLFVRDGGQAAGELGQDLERLGGVRECRRGDVVGGGLLIVGGHAFVAGGKAASVDRIDCDAVRVGRLGDRLDQRSAVVAHGLEHRARLPAFFARHFIDQREDFAPGLDLESFRGQHEDLLPFDAGQRRQEAVDRLHALPQVVLDGRCVRAGTGNRIVVGRVRRGCAPSHLSTRCGLRCPAPTHRRWRRASAGSARRRA